MSGVMTAVTNRWDPGVTRALAEARHGDAFAVLGAHPSTNGRLLRTYHPGAEHVTAVLADGREVPLEAGPEPGLFAGELPAEEATACGSAGRAAPRTRQTRTRLGRCSATSTCT